MSDLKANLEKLKEIRSREQFLEEGWSGLFDGEKEWSRLEEEVEISRIIIDQLLEKTNQTTIIIGE